MRATEQLKKPPARTRRFIHPDFSGYTDQAALELGLESRCQCQCQWFTGMQTIMGTNLNMVKRVGP